MLAQVWGCRGSVPTPGPSTVRFGGNTTCVSVEFEPGRVLVLDAGTGIRALGRTLAGRPCEIYILLTHDHWDHIQGFPFFAPIYQPGRHVRIFPSLHGQQGISTLFEQMDGAHFPVTADELLGKVELVNDHPTDFFARMNLGLTTIAANHPGGCMGYRVSRAGRSMVFMPDNEIDPPADASFTRAGRRTIDDFAAFCDGADLLLHDAMYTQADLPVKRGWGHSTVEQACELARRARVGTLGLFHHDPDRTDPQVDALQAQARVWLAKHAPSVRCHAVAEGMQFDLAQPGA
jgi:phosphoribosyl 1,2-cyclic phosphodiesterase